MKTSMRRIVAENYDELSRLGADEVAGLIAAKPATNILVATGNSPMGIYNDLARRRRAGQLDTTKMSVFQLDEYLGLGPDDRRSLFGWTMRSFVEPLGVPKSQVFRLPADNSDLDAACQAYDDSITSAGGFDLAILGLGPNGHLGFNEPPSGPDAMTRPIDLTPESIVSNGPYWGGEDQVPLRAVTVGMKMLLSARRIILVVSGEHKRSILDQTVNHPPTPDIPASFLQYASDVTVLADRQAWGPSSTS